jgi:transposase, IS30 family
VIDKCFLAGSSTGDRAAIDNDPAFAHHCLLRTRRDMTIWFCDAYASWQKGGIENPNGRLRRWPPQYRPEIRPRHPGGSSSQPTFTPVKCLGFKTPFQALIAELGKDVQIRSS